MVDMDFIKSLKLKNNNLQMNHNSVFVKMASGVYYIFKQPLVVFPSLQAKQNIVGLPVGCNGWPKKKLGW